MERDIIQNWLNYLKKWIDQIDWMEWIVYSKIDWIVLKVNQSNRLDGVDGLFKKID